MDADTFDAILVDIAAGEATHKAVAAHSVPRKAFYAFLAGSEEAGNRYAHAKIAGLDVLANEILEISDDSSGDTIEGEGGPRLDAEWVARSRLRVDSRKWLLAKLAPKKYGDRVDMELSGPNGQPLPPAIYIGQAVAVMLAGKDNPSQITRNSPLVGESDAERLPVVVPDRSDD